MTFYASHSNNRYHHYVITLAASELEEIGTVFLNDTPIFRDQIDGNGYVTSGKFSGKVRIKKHLGATNQTADSDLVSEVAEWTTAHKGQGRAYIYIRVDWDNETFPNGLPSIAAICKGMKVWDTRTSTTIYSQNAALAVDNYLRNSQFGRGAVAAEIEASETTGSANLCDEIVATADIAGTVSAVDTTLDTLSITGDRLEFQTGDQVQVTTTGGVPGGLALTTDYYIIPWQEVLAPADPEGGWSANPCQIKLATTYLNAVAGVAIDLTTAGTGTHTVTKKGEPRYTSNGVIQTENAPTAILEDLLTACGGSMTNIGGTWRVFGAAYTAPTISLDESHSASGLTVKTRVTAKDRFNRVKGLYVSLLNSGELSDYPAVVNATYVTEDNGEIRPIDHDLPYTSRPHTAQRLAKILLERSRQEITVEGAFNLHAYQVQAGDYVNLSNSRRGWTSKVFEVLESGLVGSQDKQGAPILLVKLILKEAASTFADWNSGEETTVDPAPNTTLPNAFTVTPPTSLVLTSGTSTLFLKSDGTVISRIKAAWTDSIDAFVTSYELQFKKSTDSDWEPSFIIAKGLAQSFIWDVQDGDSYDVRLRAFSPIGAGKNSSWITPALGAHTVIGKTAAPSNVTGFTAQQNGTTVTFRWDQVSDLDLSGYELRYAASGSLVWADGNSLTKVTKGTLVTNTGLPPGSWTVGVKAVDSSGNESATEATFNITVINQNDVIFGVERAPRWIGTLTNFVKHDVSGTLIPDSTSLASADGWDTFDEFVVNPETICTFEPAEMDLGFDADSLRLWAELAAALGPGEAGSADPILQVDYKDGADSYDGFEDWTVGTVNARQIKFKAKIVTTTGNAFLSGFKPVVDALERTESGAGVVIAAAGGTTLTFGTQFNTVPNIQVTPQGTSGLLAVYSAVTNTSFKVQVFDTSGTDVGGTVNWQAIGA